MREILSGEKKYEFRRSFPDLSVRFDISDIIYIYESKPTMAIVGTFRVSRYYRLPFESLMEELNIAGDYKNRMFLYLEGKDICHAMQITDLNIFNKKITLNEIRSKVKNFTPGQSYRYLPQVILDEVLGHSDL